MKRLLMKCLVVLRRFRRGTRYRDGHHLQYASQVDALMRRADPQASWNERANWMVDVTDWIRREPKVSLQGGEAMKRVKHQRTRFLLDWLDAHRDVRRIVQNTAQKTLREATGPELFTATGLPREAAFFSELVQRTVKKVLPKPPANKDLSAVFTAMFPDPADAEWLLGLEPDVVCRLWKLCGDDGIAHLYQSQIDEALVYLVTVVVSVGISPEFRQRIEPKLPLRATPFMALRRELENYLMLGMHDDMAVRSIKMLIAVCQAQTDKIYAHLDRHGVSMGLVYSIERMRAQLTRMRRLLDLRCAMGGAHTEPQVQAVLADLITAHHQRSSVRGLARRSFSLLARKMVERNAERLEPYLARDGASYRTMLRAAATGGVIASVVVLARIVFPEVGAARFFHGLFMSFNYALGFLVISAVGGVLAGRQPMMTAPALASKMGDLGSAEGMRVLLADIGALLRSQAASVFGNLLSLLPTMLLIALAAFMLTGEPVLAPDKAQAFVGRMSILGTAPLMAAFTGVLLWLASLAAGFADNWFTLRRLREALSHHRRLVHALGAVRAQRWAQWLDEHVAVIVGNVALGLLLGMTPVVAEFFGMPFHSRHITLSAGILTAAFASLGWDAFRHADAWLALAGLVSVGLLNVGVAFGCALALALRARDIPRRVRRQVWRAVLRCIASRPGHFLFPQSTRAVDASAVPEDQANADAGSGEPAAPDAAGTQADWHHRGKDAA